MSPEGHKLHHPNYMPGDSGVRGVASFIPEGFDEHHLCARHWQGVAGYGDDQTGCRRQAERTPQLSREPRAGRATR